ncbi:PTS galactitol transporter subunit IIC [Streptococcus cuniculi]|uniref:PTS galactitol transporter subunit IIC n=1 Tax=Streptococcus cuniculi TaxID=1432788 RepID=A0A4Y9JAM3_9STRE|nr:PTS transporter subunit IIC [Streptococcus cuniculi]MBF0778846.1 PTS galactitol transporter subunit IIC [Streptococcus cuniculi]TFU97228.1 PTS galactitol transporter subunit IIC [Streptococcus cuniculi]
MEFLQYIIDLGTAVMLPLVIFVIALLFGVKIGKAFYSAISIGIGFIGIGIIVDFMNAQIGPAAQAMAENFGLTLTVIDLGWPGMSPITWASSIALVAIPIAVLVNIVMLVLKMTRVVNVDIWNVWHMTFTGAIAYVATGNYWIGILGVIVHAMIAYKFGDWFCYDTDEYFGLEGIAVPHGTSAYMAPIAVIVDTIIEKIPGLNNINLDHEKIEKRLGVFGQPVVVALFLGLIIGILAGYDVKNILQLAIKVAAVISLLPKVIKPVMEGLLPISEVVKAKLQARFKGADFLIGLDPAILLGDPVVVSAGLIFIPLTIIIALIVPGNEVMPFGDLATIGFFIAMGVAVHKGNLFRTLISGIVIMFMTIWIANQSIGLTTKLAETTGTLSDSASRVAALDQGGSPVTYIFTQLFNMTNLIGFVIIGIIYAIGLYLTWTRYKKMEKENVA